MNRKREEEKEDMIRQRQERQGERKTNEKHEKYIIFMLKNAHTDNYLILTNDASSSPIADKSLFAVISLCEKRSYLVGDRTQDT